jgi:hypothetical protein
VASGESRRIAAGKREIAELRRDQRTRAPALQSAPDELPAFSALSA